MLKCHISISPSGVEEGFEEVAERPIMVFKKLSEDLNTILIVLFHHCGDPISKDFEFLHHALINVQILRPL